MPGRLLLVRVRQYVVVLMFCLYSVLVDFTSLSINKIMHVGRMFPLRCYGLLRCLLALWYIPPVCPALCWSLLCLVHARRCLRHV